ncbi:hypothetical protein [Azohydromonas lata]|uniref:Uncharacterized protein n=1 Tax=Azohydromonas lata TaxID=45677 RepID=A0ABU5IGZ3_9BURK|nr:hypothetical protein [Azohydromonas lata]MDZ5457203.1 hypothetical protein [Azohydromonas lata]
MPALKRHRRPPAAGRSARPRGAVALVTVLLLCALALLASLHAHRALLAELRGARVQQRSAQAHEAAESGLQWALAQLNAGRLDGACAPSSDAGAQRLRERLIFSLAGLRLSPASEADGQPSRAGCTLDADGAWACACGGSGAPASALETPSFSVQVAAGPRADLMALRSRGCLGCGEGELDAQAPAEWLLALVPAITGLPAAPLTVRGTVRLPGFNLRLSTRERDAQGLLLHAGGVVDASSLQPGEDRAQTLRLVAERDPELARLSAGRLLHRHLGLDPLDLARAPGMQIVRCDGDCADALRTAVDRGAQALWVDGDLSLPAGLTLGSVDAPVLLAVQGAARLGPGVRLHGLLAAASLQWHARPGGDFIRGAVLVDGDCCEGSGAPALERDAALLRRLARQAGRFVAVPGSWKDFE